MAVLAAAAAAAGAWTPAFGSSLVSIGVLNPDLPLSAVYAVSQDGSYVVGYSKSAGLYSGAGNPADATTNAVVIWSASDGLVELSCPSGQDTTGIGVTVGIGSNDGNIIVVGLHEGTGTTQRYYKAPLNDLTSGAWADCAQAGSLPTSDMRGGRYNDVRSDPSIADGRWYTAGRQASNGRNARLRGDPFIGWNGTVVRNVMSVSAYGVNVGRDNTSGTSYAFVEGPGAAYTFTQVPGSTGYRADGIGISASYGWSSSDMSKQWVCGQVFNYNGTSAQAFRWMRGDASMTFLGTLPDDASSVAYTVADTGVTAGRSYNATTSDDAVVWDTSGTWDSTGTAQSLKALLEADGVDTSEWSKLSDVYACSDDGTVLAGTGVWAADSSIRGFVATKTATVPVVVQVTNVTVSGTTVTLDFTSSNTSDTTASFAVEEAGVLVPAGALFSEMTSGVTITGSAGSFQATFAPSGDQHFYRIKRL